MRMGIHWQDLLNSCVHRSTLPNLSQRSHRMHSKLYLYCAAANQLAPYIAL